MTPVRITILPRRFIVLAFALFTLGGVFAAPAGATTDGTTPPVFPSGVVLAGNPSNGPVHKVWTQRLPAAACKAVRKASPKADCAITVTMDARIVNGPQDPPAGAQVTAQAAPASADSSYWIYETGTITARGPLYWAQMVENVAYHDYCPGANCSPQGIAWNQWIDISAFGCGPGCTISDRTDGVINNGHQIYPGGYSADLNGWEDFVVNCDLSITGNSAGCNAGHGNRLYFNGDGWWGGFSY
jgi:hypothetical protein